MEVDLRVRFGEIVEKEGEPFAELHLVDDYPLTEEEMKELKESLVATIRASTYFINWEKSGGERSFAAKVSHVNTKY